MQLFLFSNFLISCSPKAALRNIWILFWRVPETQIPNESQHLTEIPETNERKTEKPFVQSVHIIQNCWTHQNASSSLVFLYLIFVVIVAVVLAPIASSSFGVSSVSVKGARPKAPQRGKPNNILKYQ